MISTSNSVQSMAVKYTKKGPKESRDPNFMFSNFFMKKGYFIPNLLLGMKYKKHSYMGIIITHHCPKVGSVESKFLGEISMAFGRHECLIFKSFSSIFSRFLHTSSNIFQVGFLCFFFWRLSIIQSSNRCFAHDQGSRC